MAPLSASISYVPFHAFCNTGSAATALYDVLRPKGVAAPLFQTKNRSLRRHRGLKTEEVTFNVEMCRDIDNVSAHSRWPLTTGVAQGRYYCTCI